LLRLIILYALYQYVLINQLFKQFNYIFKEDYLFISLKNQYLGIQVLIIVLLLNYKHHLGQKMQVFLKIIIGLLNLQYFFQHLNNWNF